MSFCPNCGSKIEDNARFCSYCGQPTSSISNVVKSQSENTQPLNCPRCGAPINSYAAVCGACGCEINSKTQSSSCKDLVDKLDQIEATRPKKGLFSMVKGFVNSALDKDEVLDETDQRKVELISNYVIVNNKVEILDFIILANSKINSCEKLLKTCGNDDEYTKLAQEQMREIWSNKLNEAIDKGDIVLSEDQEYLKLKNKVLAEQSQRFKAKGLCMYCGGKFKGVFSKVCSSCGKPKNY